MEYKLFYTSASAIIVGTLDEVNEVGFRLKDPVVIDMVPGEDGQASLRLGAIPLFEEEMFIYNGGLIEGKLDQRLIDNYEKFLEMKRERKSGIVKASAGSLEQLEALSKQQQARGQKSGLIL